MKMVSIRQGFLVFTALAGLAAARPSKRFTDPTDNGFPNPNATGLAAIEKQADGQLGNAPPPPKLNASSVAAFQLIAFNELFEVAYFTSLRYNVSNEVCGYETEDKKRLVSILDTIIAVSSHFLVLTAEPRTDTRVSHSKRSFMQLTPWAW
jgi:hypothetical protein